MTQKRIYFGKISRDFQNKLAKERIRTRPGEKTEEEIRLFGRKWVRKEESYKSRVTKEEKERDSKLTVYERIARDMELGKFKL